MKRWHGAACGRGCSRRRAACVSACPRRDGNGRASTKACARRFERSIPRDSGSKPTMRITGTVVRFTRLARPTRRHSMTRFALTVFFCVATLHAHAAITVTDDTGAGVTLAAPAQRVISLAPHVTELLYAAGGGAKLVGAVSYSDYPPEAKQVPRVGDNKALDLERIVALKPDLIVVWRHGNHATSPGGGG